MDKETVVCIYTQLITIQLQKKERILPLVTTWMDIESIMLSEISQPKRQPNAEQFQKATLAPELSGESVKMWFTTTSQFNFSTCQILTLSYFFHRC